MNLKPFCATGHHSRFDACNKPQTFAGWTWATDARVLIRVPAVGPDTATQRKGRVSWFTADGGLFPNVTEMPMPTPEEIADASLWQPWPSFDFEMGNQCGRCDGTKRIRVFEPCHCCGGFRRPCPYCAGRYPDGPFPRLQKMGDLIIALEYDEAIRQLPAVRWRPIKAPLITDSSNVVQFCFDGGNGLLVPLTRVVNCAEPAAEGA